MGGFCRSIGIDTTPKDKDKDDKPSGVGAGNKLSDGSTSLGSVSQTGQYAGDGFEWKQNPNTNALTRVYTGANKDAGLGTDVKSGGTSDKKTKEAIAKISLDEGTAFAGSAASATDGNVLNLLTDGTTGASDSYAAQVGATDFTPAVTYDSKATGAANDLLREQPEPPAPDPTNFAVSQGEAGRGGPDSAAPTFTYAAGVDPEMEMLVSLLNTAPQTLSAGERLMAQQYQNDRAEAGFPTGGVQVADASPFMSQVYSSLAQPFSFLSDPLANLAVGIPRNISEGISGVSSYFDRTAPISSISGTGITNPAFFAVDELQKYFMPEEVKTDRILSQDVNRDPSAGVQGGQALASGFGYVADTLEDYLNPGSQAVVTGDRFSDLNVVDARTGQDLSGGDAVSGLVNLAAGEGLADTGVDILMGLNPYTRGLSAVINAGEQLTGLEAGISDQIDNAYVAGQLDDNPMFQRALKAQDGNVDNALAVLKNLSYSADVGGVPAYALTAASGAVDAALPGPKGGITGLAKEGVKRAGVEGGQGAFESATAINAVNSALGTNFDPTANIAGAATTEAIAGATGAVVSPFVGTNQTASQRRFIQDSALGNQAAMQQAAGTQGIASFAPGPVNQTAVATQPEAMTTSPTIFNPNLSQTAGELAQSNVPTSYDIEQDRVAGLLEGPQALDSSASSLDVIAAQRVIEDQIQQTGTVSPQTISDLQAATGLSENDLNSIAVNAALGISSDQAVPTSAIQMFDQAAAPSTDPSIDTVAPSLPTFNVAGAPGQPVLPAGVDTSPIIPTRSTTPNIPSIDVAGLGSLQTESLPNVDTSSFQQGIASAQDNNPNQPAPIGTTFTTARGSTYTVTADGTTVRNRAPDEEGGDFVQQPQSGKTIFVSNEDKQKFGSLFQQGEPGLYQFTPVAGTTNKAQLVFTKDYGPNKAGDPVPGTEITYSNTPESGQSPIEIYNSTNDNPNNIHFGSEITQVGDQGDDGSVEAQLPTTTDGDTLPAATGTEVIIDDDGSARQVGGLEGEILGPEISTEVNPEEDTGVTIDMEATTETDTTPQIETDNLVQSNIPNVTRTTTTDTAVDQNIKPLIEVDVDEPPEPPEEVDPEKPVVVEIDDDDDTFVPPVTKTDDKGNIITECPEGYMEVQTPDGIICEKITTATTTTGRRTYGVGRTATTGLAGNIGRQIPRSRTRTTTTTSRSRVKPTTRSA